MTIATVCASHTPLMDIGPVDQSVSGDVDGAFAGLAEFVRKFEPDLIIQFSPDHYNGFLYDLMPAFCIGAAAYSVGDYSTIPGQLPVPEAEAMGLAGFVLEQGIDTAFSLRMPVDHGFVQIWEKMFGSATTYPLIPIFINSAAPPLPTYRRARLLGEAVGKWALNTGKRVLFAASGGLSHDPPLPKIDACPPEVRERLIAGRNPSAEARAAHVRKVLAAGEAAAKGEGPCLPLSREWDEMVIELFKGGDLTRFDSFDPDEVRKIGGCGANEIYSWVAAFAAQSMAGPYSATVNYYAPIDGWIAGMGMMTATEVSKY